VVEFSSYDLSKFEFHVAGARAWGITSALAAAGYYSGDFSKVPQWKRDRGTAVAKAVSNWVMELDGVVRPNTPLAQFVRALQREQLRPVASEFFLPGLIDGYLPFVAIPDLVALDRSDNLVLINVKCGRDKPVYGIQTAAEAIALHQAGIDIHERMTLSLYNDRYDLTRHRRAQDYQEFVRVVRKLGLRNASYETASPPAS